jgi:hypothetical protein
MAKARAAVLAARERLLWAGVRLNSWVNNGIKGCTQYSAAKVAHPPATMPSVVRQKAELPSWIRDGRSAMKKNPEYKSKDKAHFVAFVIRFATKKVVKSEFIAD